MDVGNAVAAEVDDEFKADGVVGSTVDAGWVGGKFSPEARSGS